MSKTVQLLYHKTSDTQSEPLPLQEQYQQTRRPEVVGCTVLYVPVYTVLSIYGLRLDGMEQPPNSDYFMKSVNVIFHYFICNCHLNTLIIAGEVDTQGFEMPSTHPRTSYIKRHYLLRSDAVKLCTYR